MLIYSGTKGSFSIDVDSGRIADIVNAKFWQHGILHENESEYLSWKNSLRYMRDVLADDCFPDELQVAVEYQIPKTSKRVDFMIAGEDQEGSDHVIVVELKQWHKALRTRRQDVVKAYTGGASQDVPHPSYQAFSYAKTIQNFSETVQSRHIGIHPCAYLHNYELEFRDQIEHPTYDLILKEAPVYLKEDEQKLRGFLKKYIKRAPKHNVLYEIDNGRIRPSKSLQDAVSSMLEGNDEFIMLDEQKVVFETVKQITEEAIKKNRKYTIIVQGGPGTGKSVVAIQLLVALIRQGRNCQYVTKNATPRNVYFEKLRREGRLTGYTKALFQSSTQYIAQPENTFDCLLVDEAHRLNAKSFIHGGYYGENQIKEIIYSALVSVFFIDEEQKVTASDIGTINEIKKWANVLGSTVYCDDSTVLKSQYRCNGSDGYIAFIDDFLGICPRATKPDFANDYLFRTFDNPTEMREELQKLNEVNNKARMLAGYCWEWDSRYNSRVMDIRLKDGFEAQWNFKNTTTWAIDSKSFDQIGCIHTSQGVEFDYVGVIIGKDLMFQNGKVEAVPQNRAKSDYSLKGALKKGGFDFAEQLIKNTYKVLLTRGQKGCFVYCEDQALQDYLNGKLAPIADSQMPSRKTQKKCKPEQYM